MAGLTLKEQQEQILEEKQNEYKGFISQFINDRTEGYSYAEEEEFLAIRFVGIIEPC